MYGEVRVVKISVDRPQPVSVGVPLSAGGKAPHKGECTAAGILMLESSCNRSLVLMPVCGRSVARSLKSN